MADYAKTLESDCRLKAPVQSAKNEFVTKSEQTFARETANRLLGGNLLVAHGTRKVSQQLTIRPLVRAQTGLSLHVFLANKRLEWPADLLGCTGMRVKEITCSVGNGQEPSFTPGV